MKPNDPRPPQLIRVIPLAAALACTQLGCCAGRAPVEVQVNHLDVAEERLSEHEFVERIWRQGERVLGTFTRDETVALHALVPRVFDLAHHAESVDTNFLNARLPALAEAARTAGFTLALWDVSGTRVLVLLEARHEGRGAYVFRIAPASPSPLILESPHAYFDVDSGRLGARLFLRDGVGDVFFTNTVHRYFSTNGDRTPRANADADVCRQRAHPFHLATTALLEHAPRSHVVQLHGFAEDLERPVDAVLSTGTEHAEALIAVAEQLRALPVQIALYPTDIGVLGATENEQGRAANALGSGRFLHAELSRGLRRRLMHESALRAAFGRAITQAEPTP